MAHKVPTSSGAYGNRLAPGRGSSVDGGSMLARMFAPGIGPNGCTNTLGNTIFSLMDGEKIVRSKSCLLRNRPKKEEAKFLKKWSLCTAPAFTVLQAGSKLDTI